MSIKKWIFFLSLLILGGCANPYQKFYTGLSPEQIRERYGARPAAEPSIHVVGDVDAATIDMMESGFQMIGSSNFTGPNPRQENAVAQGKAIGADVVLFATKYSNTVTSVIPLTLPTSSTTYSTGNATAYGANGVVNAYGSGMSTTYGSQTTMIPTSVDRYSAFASYWVKGKKPIFGFQGRLTTPKQRLEAGTNRGIAIIVVRGSPFFKADIMTGDLLLKIGDVDMNTPDDVPKIIQYAGQKVNVVIQRMGKEMVKTVQAEVAQ